jgi:hypothetical protein
MFIIPHFFEVNHFLENRNKYYKKDWEVKFLLSIGTILAC